MQRIPIKFENVGIAVRDLEATIAFFADLGLNVQGRRQSVESGPTCMPMAEGLGVCAATAMLLVALASCAEDDPQPDGDGKRASPCEHGAIHDLGVPGPFCRIASFEVVKGPVWFAVKDWQVTGVIDPRGQKGLPTLGPLEQPPVVDQNGHIASKSEQVEVEKALSADSTSPQTAIGY